MKSLLPRPLPVGWVFAPLLLASVSATLADDGDGSVEISGERRIWHVITLTVDGPWAEEQGEMNPFTDIAMKVAFTHESGSPSYLVLGYFAADGKAAETSADRGSSWRAHLSPDRLGTWSYRVDLRRTDEREGAGARSFPGHGAEGTFEVLPSEKQAPDFRGRGRLEYVGERYLRFAGDGSRFLKAGPDAPETLLAFTDFDGTEARNPKKGPLKTWAPHLRDWREGDPIWQGGKGKGLIGALNYLSSEGLNSVSFLTYNAGGDGDNVWPFVLSDEKLRYDCSKLDQWGIVFEHANARGLHLHFKLQETENDDRRRGQKRGGAAVPAALDGGALGPERKLYLRELVARFSHLLALNWNLGEENTQSTDEIRAMASYLRELDPYDHPLVIHTYPNQQDRVYPTLLGERSELTGASLQNPWNRVHQRTRKWIEASSESGKPWVVANDEQNPAGFGVPPDPGYRGFDGWARGKDGAGRYNWTDIRRETLWGNLMAGGAGVEYYFGYQLPENDLVCEDFRSREKSWQACRIALEFFRDREIPFWEMESRDDLVGNGRGESGAPWCLAKPGNCYLVFVPARLSSAALGLTATIDDFVVDRFHPDTGEFEEALGRDAVSVAEKASTGYRVKVATPEERDTVFVIRATGKSK